MLHEAFFFADVFADEILTWNVTVRDAGNIVNDERLFNELPVRNGFLSAILHVLGVVAGWDVVEATNRAAVHVERHRVVVPDCDLKRIGALSLLLGQGEGVTQEVRALHRSVIVLGENLTR